MNRGRLEGNLRLIALGWGEWEKLWGHPSNKRGGNREEVVWAERMGFWRHGLW